MLAVVIPARDEAARIQGLLGQVLRIPADLVVPVLNGCRDMTAAVVKRNRDHRIKLIQFKEPLGYDVPRIAGAKAALDAGAQSILFIDGDLNGPVLGRLVILVERVKKGLVDLSLSDCYAGTPIPYRKSAARDVYTARIALNKALEREDLGAGIPSHGPVAVSRRLLETVPLWSVGIPPVMQAYACRMGLRVEVGACVPHRELGSAQREQEHRQKIAETIIGDCLCALCVAERRPPDREGHVGYHNERRFDLVGVEPPEGV